MSSVPGVVLVCVLAARPVAPCCSAAATGGSGGDRFPVGSAESLEHLDQHGYVVLASALSAEEVREAERLLWEYLESVGLGINRHDPDTWGHWPGMEQVGIIHSHGVGQSPVMWYARSRAAVKRAFAAVWNDTQLLSSFDGLVAFRPPERDPAWTTVTGWEHMDQSPRKTGRHCVQGLVQLYDSGAATGGLVVLPGSHLLHDAFTQRLLRSRTYPPELLARDYVRVRDAQLLRLPQRTVGARAGDLVLWDSRTVHHSAPAARAPGRHNLTRAAPLVCMTPRRLARRGVLAQRVRAVRMQETTTHWPHEFHLAGWDVERGPRPRGGGFRWPTPLRLTAAVNDLI